MLQQISQPKLANEQSEIQITARHVVVSQPAPQASTLLASLSKSLSSLLAGIQYTPLTVIHQGFQRGQVKKALNGSGFLLPNSEQQVMLGNLWLSSLFNHRAPNEKLLLTSYLGGCRSPEVKNWSEQHCIEQAQYLLHRYLGISSEAK